MNVHPQDLDKFAPLTPQERAAIQSARGNMEGEGELVSPIPSDAPDPTETHRTLGKPSQVWTYRDAHGGTLFHILRFDPPRRPKVFLPLSLWRDAAGLGWRWNHVSPPRPKLAARPDAPVVICEGEKSAHAAARISRTAFASLRPAVRERRHKPIGRRFPGARFTLGRTMT